MANAHDTHTRKPVPQIWYEIEHCLIYYQKLIPEKVGTKLYVRRMRNWYRFSGTSYWC